MITYSDQNEFKGIKILWTENNFIVTIEEKVNIGIDGEKITITETEDSDGKVLLIGRSPFASKRFDCSCGPRN